MSDEALKNLQEAWAAYAATQGEECVEPVTPQKFCLMMAMKEITDFPEWEGIVAADCLCRAAEWLERAAKIELAEAESIEQEIALICMDGGETVQ